jgi:uncharacterized lipoprotein YajG
VVERNLRTARYANNCYAGYLSLTASPHVRRLLNQAFRQNLCRAGFCAS